MNVGEAGGDSAGNAHASNDVAPQRTFANLKVVSCVIAAGGDGSECAYLVECYNKSTEDAAGGVVPCREWRCFHRCTRCVS